MFPRKNKPGAGRPRTPFPCPAAEVRAILATQTGASAARTLGISQSQAYAWRRQLGVENPRLFHDREHVTAPAFKGLTWAVIRAALMEHPEGLHLNTVAAQVGCSRQAVLEKLRRLERRGLVFARYRASGRREGWFLLKTTSQQRGQA